MSSHSDDQQSAKRQISKPSRFRIEKLEERIAPAKGGIPGKPGGSDSYPPDSYGGYCWLHGRHRWCDP